ncbi:MAG: tetratricopeptide repeat protein, partial [Cyanobacteria bacterium P01_H01_bin.121]
MPWTPQVMGKADNAELDAAAAQQSTKNLHISTELLHYERAVAEDPDNGKLWCRRGNLLAQLGRYDDAL